VVGNAACLAHGRYGRHLAVDALVVKVTHATSLASVGRQGVRGRGCLGGATPGDGAAQHAQVASAIGLTVAGACNTIGGAGYRRWVV